MRIKQLSISSVLVISGILGAAVSAKEMYLWHRSAIDSSLVRGGQTPCLVVGPVRNCGNQGFQPGTCNDERCFVNNGTACAKAFWDGSVWFDAGSSTSWTDPCVNAATGIFGADSCGKFKIYCLNGVKCQKTCITKDDGLNYCEGGGGIRKDNSHDDYMLNGEWCFGA